jgi:segregation and condensation protein B
MEQEQLKEILLSLLFTSGRPLKSKYLAKILEVEEQAVKAALDAAVAENKDHGIILLENSGEYQLATNSKYSPQVKNFLNAELREKLTDATVEVLAIIAYRQPISKAEIEAIRGVNSQYSVRNLLMRGLVEKIPNPNDSRSVLYQTTTEFLMHMGLTSIKELPAFEKLVENIKLQQTPGLQQSEAAQEKTTEQTPLAPATDLQAPEEEKLGEPETDEDEDEDEDDEDEDEKD